jgi:branched-chain amino acid transport system substrate-binding protein
MTGKGWRVLVGAVLLGTLVGTACSSSSSSSSKSASPTSTVAPDLSLLGPAKRATGDPLKIGYIYAGQAQSQDNTNELNIAKATVSYVNEHLGGVAGRPVELVVCADHLTPAGATDCANQMLTAKVTAVLAGNPANPAPIIKLLEPAKIPLFVETAADASVLLSSDSNVLTNPLVILAAPIKVAQDAGEKKVAMVYVDVPAAAQLKVVGEPMFKKAGLTLIATGVPLGTPDVTPQVQAAISSGAQQFVVVGDTSLCVTTLKALKTLGFQGKVLSNANCLTDASAKAIPGGFDGLIVPATRVYDNADPEYALLRAIAAQYAPGTPTNDEGQAALGYVSVMGFARAMKDLKPSAATADGIGAAFLAMSPQTVPLLTGQTFRCNRKVSTLAAAACSNGVTILTVDKSGQTTHSETFDATSYLQ